MSGLAQRTAAIVGYGSIGRRHAENLRRLGVSKLILLRRTTLVNPAFEPPPDAQIVHNAATALALRPDVAIVCTPTQGHVDAARPFIEAGVPTLIEKPVAADLPAARNVLAAVQRSGVCCGVAYCMRYHPAYAQAREAIRAGNIGRMLYAKAWFESWLPAWHPWEDYRQSYAARRELGGGVLPTLDHELDFLAWCLGKPQCVQGISRRSGALEIEVDDLACLCMQYADGVMADCLLSFCRPDRQRGFEFVGSQASLRFSLETGQLLLCPPDQQAQVLWDGRAYDTNQMYHDLLADFLTALTNGSPPPAPLEAGIAALEIAAQVRSQSLDG